MAQIPRIEAIVQPPAVVERSENRRDWAMIALFGGAMVMTILAASCLYILRDNAEYVFWVAISAQVQILAVLTAFAGLLVKRTLKISKSEISIIDTTEENPQDTDLVRRGDVEQEIQEVPAVDVPAENKNGRTDQPG